MENRKPKKLFHICKKTDFGKKEDEKIEKNCKGGEVKAAL
jgi:hypothetical protein